MNPDFKWNVGVDLGNHKSLHPDSLDLGNQGPAGLSPAGHDHLEGDGVSSQKHRDNPSQMDATRFVLYHVLACILSSEQNTAFAAIDHLQKVEGVTTEHLQLLKRVAAEQRQYLIVWTLNNLILESKIGAEQASVHDIAEKMVEGVELLVQTLDSAETGCKSTMEMMQRLLKQLSVGIESIEELVRTENLALG